MGQLSESGRATILPESGRGQAGPPPRRRRLLCGSCHHPPPARNRARKSSNPPSAERLSASSRSIGVGMRRLRAWTFAHTIPFVTMASSIPGSRVMELLWGGRVLLPCPLQGEPGAPSLRLGQTPQVAHSMGHAAPPLARRSTVAKNRSAHGLAARTFAGSSVASSLNECAPFPYLPFFVGFVALSRES